ncbi:MAG TPA: VWA domain-containing protein [Bryobacteraceae bacterium]|jgi:VWFA-related protein|nr:VWA domain-containing protein [Bryobacteraceae bacterium]
MRVHSTRRELLQAVAAWGGVRFAGAQDTPVFSTDVKVVNVLATVRNKTGSLVGNLSQDDFLLSEDGHPQTIRYFARESNLPLTLGLMVDTSGSQRRVLDAERGACLRFLDQVVREKQDQVFIMQFDSAVQMRQALTSSVARLDDALAYVDTETMRQLRMQNGGGTLLYDAVARASDDVMKKQKGRKALIVLSDGVDFGSYGTLQDAVEAALRADTLIYSILYSDPGAYGLFGGHDGARVLQRMSSETGGSFFEVSKKQTVDRMFEILQDELRNQYSLGYVSDKPVTLSGFRAIQLTARQKGLAVQARRQYWAQR